MALPKLPCQRQAQQSGLLGLLNALAYCKLHICMSFSSCKQPNEARSSNPGANLGGPAENGVGKMFERYVIIACNLPCEASAAQAHFSFRPAWTSSALRRSGPAHASAIMSPACCLCVKYVLVLIMTDCTASPGRAALEEGCECMVVVQTRSDDDF